MVCTIFRSNLVPESAKNATIGISWGCRSIFFLDRGRWIAIRKTMNAALDEIFIFLKKTKY